MILLEDTLICSLCSRFCVAISLLRRWPKPWLETVRSLRIDWLIMPDVIMRMRYPLRS